MTELATIDALRALFPVSSRQKNSVFTCDAELFQLGGHLYGISMDDFSREEDAFNDENLALLGWNLAVATIADILAAGCLPELFLHAIVEPTEPVREGFALGIAKGVRDALAACDCRLLGGDMGKAATWRYMGVVLGPSLGPRGLTRILPPKKQTLWLTGALGDGNLCAFDSSAHTRFELRLKEARALNGLASACMDTSGGLADSFVMLAKVNPEHSFHVRLDSLPFDERCRAAAQAYGLPVAGFAFGGAGEYELLFATDEDLHLDYATPIGTAAPSATPGVFWNDRLMPCNLPDPRSFADRQRYIRELLTVVDLCTR